MISYAIAAIGVGAAALAISDGKYRIERSILISTPAPEVFKIIADFRQFQHWSPWEDLDPQLQKEYQGEAGEIGSSYAWNGNQKVGEGKITVVEVDPGHRLELRMEFIRPFEDTCSTVWSVDPQGAGSIVTWSFRGENKGVLRKLLGLVFQTKKLLSKDFDKGLTRLKGYCEQSGGPTTSRVNSSPSDD